MKEVKIICIIKRATEHIKKKLIKLIFLIPKFQYINNSLFNSYFAITYEKLKKNANGKILLSIFGKFNKEYFK